MMWKDQVGHSYPCRCIEFGLWWIGLGKYTPGIGFDTDVFEATTCPRMVFP